MLIREKEKAHNYKSFSKGSSSSQCQKTHKQNIQSIFWCKIGLLLGLNEPELKA